MEARPSANGANRVQRQTLLVKFSCRLRTRAAARRIGVRWIDGQQITGSQLSYQPRLDCFERRSHRGNDPEPQRPDQNQMACNQIRGQGPRAVRRRATVATLAPKRPAGFKAVTGFGFGELLARN